MAFEFSNFSNIRYNPVTQSYNPLYITGERHTVDADGRIYLYETIQQRIPSATNMVDVETPGNVLNETTSPVPGLGKYWVCYDALGNGTVQFHSSMIGKEVDATYYGLGTRIQKSTMIASITGFPTVILASSDSLATSQNNASQVISIAEDAGAVINSWITTINASGGGRIVLYEGTYNCATFVNILDNITLEGTGFATILKRNGAISHVIFSDNKNYIEIKNISIDGNKAIYNSGTRRGIYALSANTITFYNNLYVYDNFTDGLFGCENINNIYSYNNDQYGFGGCARMTNCRANGNQYGFFACERMSASESYLNSKSGFSGCKEIDSCYSQSNTEYGYIQCDGISSSRAYLNTKSGFNLCDRISSCWSHQNTEYGYISCNQISTSLAESNSLDGFNTCIIVNNCASNSNTSGAATVYGYRSCKGMLNNQGSSNKNEVYKSCYVDKGTAVSMAWAGAIAGDTATYGWNTGTGVA